MRNFRLCTLQTLVANIQSVASGVVTVKQSTKLGQKIMDVTKNRHQIKQPPTFRCRFPTVMELQATKLTAPILKIKSLTLHTVL